MRLQEKVTPYVSVIVPTFNRRWYLERLIPSLFSQTYPKDSYEVIIVDNDSKDGTDQLIESFRKDAPCVLKYHKKENEGPGVARNVGIAMARGHVIAFVDSDCVADCGWIENGISKMTDGVGLVQGRTLPDPDEEIGIFSYVTRVDVENSLYQTCNMFYRKAILDELGGFSPDFSGIRFGRPTVGGEDIDLAWRVKKLGWKSSFAGGAIIYHQVVQWYPMMRAEAPFRFRFFYNFCYVIPKLIKKHTELRKTLLYKKIFWSRITALFDIFFVSILLGIFLPQFYILTAISSLWLLKHFFKGRSLRTYRGVFVLAFVTTFQHFFIFVYLLCGSIRYRSLVL